MKLYKYKKIKGKNYKQLNDILEKEYLYCAKVDTFDDVFDGKLPFSIHEDTRKITTDFVRDSLVNECKYFISQRHTDKQRLFHDIDVLLKNTDLSYIDHNDECLDFTYEEEIEEISVLNEAINFFCTPSTVLYFQNKLKCMLNRLKDLRVCSLCSEKDNQVLWAMYGDSFKGACIEYEVSDQDVKKVRYDNRELYDPLLYMMKEYEKNCQFDVQVANRLIDELIITKHKSWKFQKEYRVINQSGNEKVSCKITGLYLGYKVSKSNLERILKDFKERYPIYTMDVNHYDQTFDFKILNKDILLRMFKQKM